MEYGILGLIILVLDIYAVVKVLGSGATTLAKLLWILAIIFLPLIGLIAWAVAGPRGNRISI